MKRNYGRPAVRVPEECMAAARSHDGKAQLLESAYELLRAAVVSYRNLLNSDEFQLCASRIVDVKAEFNGLAHAFH
jgi:hypothetical protein